MSNNLLVLNRFTIILAILAALLLTDVHWGVMQSITWAKMVSEGDRSVTLITRITQTVSGQAPCDHCVALEGERTSEQEETLNLLAKSQVIAPISVANLQFSHPGVALFRVGAEYLIPAAIAPGGIDHPPRV